MSISISVALHEALKTLKDRDDVHYIKALHAISK